MPEAKKPKIVRIIARLNTGGPARQACYLHEHMRNNFETVLVTGSLESGEGDMNYLLGCNDGVYQVGSMSRAISYWKDAVAFCRIVGILRRERPDIVHTHTAKAGAIGRAAALLARVPVTVHTYHGNVFQSYFGPLKTRVFVTIERLLGKMTSTVVAVSESQAGELTGKFGVLPRSKIAVIPNGFQLSAFSTCSERERIRADFNVAPDQLLVVWAARMVPVKDPGLLARVIQRTVNDPRIRFLVVGDGIERPAIEDAVRGCPNVTFTGWRRDMESIWTAADVALLTSRNEGTPTALIEAMAAGKPFVATAVGGVPDMLVPPIREITPGTVLAANGIAVPPTPEALSTALELLLKDKDQARAMGEVGREYVLQRYAAERLARDMMNLYTSLLEQAAQADTSSSGVAALKIRLSRRRGILG